MLKIIILLYGWELGAIYVSKKFDYYNAGFKVSLLSEQYLDDERAHKKACI